MKCNAWRSCFLSISLSLPCMNFRSIWYQSKGPNFATSSSSSPYAKIQSLKKTSILMDYTEFRESIENNFKEAKMKDLESTLLNIQSIMNSSKADTSTMVLSGFTNNQAARNQLSDI